MAPETTTDIETLQTPKLNGRRALRAELEATHKLHVKDPNNTSTQQPMASRRIRRSIAKAKNLDFRPVFFHAIPVDIPHKAVIRAMLTMSRTAAARYLRSLKSSTDALVAALETTQGNISAAL